MVDDSENRPDPSELLKFFVASNRRESAFTALVESLSGLVYSSALRRTQNSQLAEEIAQNVFAIMARKAESLWHHPSLTAWVLETTRLQSASAMRSEKRRQRKLAALASETNAQHAMPTPEPAWKDALPHVDEALDGLPEKDRKVVLQRFYEGKKFKEIATQNGQTEAACKMRVKRALEKISARLTARGVTLSLTALASALGTELTRAAPAQAVADMASNALATSSSIPLTTLLAITLQTMGSLKTATVTSMAVLAIAAVPFFQLCAHESRLESELKALGEQQPVPETNPLIGPVAHPKRDSATAAKPAASRSAGSLLASLDRPVKNREFIKDLMEVTGIPDTMAQNVAWSRVQRMTPEERRELLRALRGFPMPRVTKDVLVTQIIDHSPEMTPSEQLEQVIAVGRSTGFQHYMTDWAVSEPDAALEWFWEKRASGELYRGLGRLNGGIYEWILSDLLQGVAVKNPAKVLDFYRKLPEGEIDESNLRNMAVSISRGEIERGEQTWFREMLETHSGEDREEILRGILTAHVGKELFDEGMAIVDEYNPAPQERDQYLENIFRAGLPFWKLGSGLDWLLASTPQEEAPAVMRRMVSMANFNSQSETLEWVERQEPGLVRDYGYAGMVEELLDSAFTDDFPTVIPAAEKIEDPALRTEIRQLIRKKWNDQDKAKASQYLPADLFEQLEQL